MAVISIGARSLYRGSLFAGALFQGGLFFRTFVTTDQAQALVWCTGQPQALVWCRAG